MNEMFLYHVKLRTDLQKAEQRVAVSQTELRDAQKVVELSRHLVKDLQDDLFDKFRRALNSQTQRLVEREFRVTLLRSRIRINIVFHSSFRDLRSLIIFIFIFRR